MNKSSLNHEVFLSMKLVCSVAVQITMNAHASLSYMLAALGINLVPSMPMIYVVFASLVSISLCLSNVVQIQEDKGHLFF